MNVKNNNQEQITYQKPEGCWILDDRGESVGRGGKTPRHTTYWVKRVFIAFRFALKNMMRFVVENWNITLRFISKVRNSEAAF
jgi:hypothetical protein